ncbi:hypothetical protein [Bradyrhizobium sp. STM 3562]|uniref:hypothetical protein n=1 Tax=Bradyrhizobium sp. STM 3562 TaxID=578924 RepID=UPI003890C814
MMLSRALSLATVTLLIGCCAAGGAQAQENLDAGKSPSQIFAGTCTACHKSPRGLLKTVAPGSLQGFLRQHYTTSPEMAGVLSSYLVSNGATDTRYGEKQKAGKEAKSDGKPAGATDQPDRAGRRRHPVSAAPQEAEPRQESEAPAANEPGRPRRNAKRQAPTADAPEAGQPAAEGRAPTQAAGEHGADGRKLSAKRRRGKPGLEEGAPSPLEPAREEAGSGGAPQSTSEAPKTEASRPDAGRGEGGNPAEASSPPQAVNAEPAKQTEAPALRPDPVPPVTPAATSTSSSAPAVAAPSLSATPAESTQGTSPSEPPAPASK